MIERSGETENLNRFLEVSISFLCVTQLGVYLEKGESLIGPRQCAELAIVTRVS